MTQKFRFIAGTRKDQNPRYVVDSVGGNAAILRQCGHTMNGWLARRQIKGLPMGLACAPQLATLSCCRIEREREREREREDVLKTKPTGLVTRILDDF